MWHIDKNPKNKVFCGDQHSRKAPWLLTATPLNKLTYPNHYPPNQDHSNNDPYIVEQLTFDSFKLIDLTAISDTHPSLQSQPPQTFSCNGNPLGRISGWDKESDIEVGHYPCHGERMQSVLLWHNYVIEDSEDKGQIKNSIVKLLVVRNSWFLDKLCRGEGLNRDICRENYLKQSRHVHFHQTIVFEYIG